jgi:hypothetical protein
VIAHDEFRDFLQERVGDLLAPSGPDWEEHQDEAPLTGVVTAWVVITEVADDEGRRWITWTIPPDQTTWLTRGMLHEAQLEVG